MKPLGNGINDAHRLHEDYNDEDEDDDSDDDDDEGFNGELVKAKEWRLD